MAPTPPPGAGNRTAMILGMAAVGVGALGILVCLGLIGVVLVARSRAIGRVDAIADRLDEGLARGIPLLVAAAERVDATAARVGAVGAALRERAANPEADARRAETLREVTSALSDAHHALRTAYADAHERVISVLDRLDTLDRAVPAVEIPRGPVEALASLDSRVLALDADVTALLAAASDVGSGPVAEAALEKAGRLATAFEAASNGIRDVRVRLDALRAATAVRADRVRTLVTVTAVVGVVALLYFAFLHGVLYRTGRIRRGN